MPEEVLPIVKGRELKKLRIAKSISENMEMNAKILTELNSTVKKIRKDKPATEDFLVSEENKYHKTMKKTGTALILTAPIPIVSDVLGISLLTLGIVGEYKKRKNLQKALSDYLEFLNDPIV